MKNKTIGEWLNTIQDLEARNKAIIYARAAGLLEVNIYESLPDALRAAFLFSETKEGFNYWDDILKVIRINEINHKLSLTSMTAQKLIGAKIINAGYNKLYLDNGTEIQLSPEEIDHLNTCSDGDYMTGFTPVVNQEHVTDMDEQMPFLKAVLDDENISDEFKNAISQQKF